MTDPWVWTTLGEVLIKQPNQKVIQQGWSPKCHSFPAAGGEWGVLKTTAIQAGSFRPEHNKQLPDGMVPRPNIEVRAGDLLMTCAGPRARCGVPTLVRHTPDRLMMSGKMYRFRPDDRLDSRFLELWLLSPEAQKRIDAMKTGISDSGLNLTHGRFVQLPVPVPPLVEQHRIVELLDDHLSRIDAAERGLSVSGRSCAALVRSALALGLRGILTENDLREGTAEDALGFRPDFGVRDGDRVWTLPDGWLWVRLGDVFEVNVGATPSRGDSSLWVGDLPWVSSGEVTFSRIRQTRENINREAVGSPDKRIQPPGTVMLAMIGEGKTRGQAAILDIEAAHNQNCASIRVSATKVLPEYVYGYLEERYLETRRAGSGGQQQALNKASIQRFPIPIPPLATQRSLVEAWGELRTSVARLESEVSRALQRSASLRRALLEAAFSGQLSRSNAVSEAPHTMAL